MAGDAFISHSSQDRDGYQDLSAQTAGAVITPRLARRKNQLPVFPAVAAAHEVERWAQSARRIRVEHGISHLKNWRALSRHLSRRERLDAMLCAVAELVSSQERAPRSDQLHRPPKALPAGTGQVIEPAPDRVDDRPPLTMHEVVNGLSGMVRPVHPVTAMRTASRSVSGSRGAADS